VKGTALAAAPAFRVNSASRRAFAAINDSASATKRSSLAFYLDVMVPSLFFSSNASSWRCLAAGNLAGFEGPDFMVRWRDLTIGREWRRTTLWHCRPHRARRIGLPCRSNMRDSA
jgi:hypothetical protein